MIKLNEDDTTSSSRIFIKVYLSIRPSLTKLIKGTVSKAGGAFFWGVSEGIVFGDLVVIPKKQVESLYLKARHVFYRRGGRG